MASQSGQNYIISFIPQTVIGTPVTGAGGTVLRTNASTGWSLNRARIQSEELRADGMRGAPRKGVKSAPGSTKSELSFTSFDGVFEHFFRSSFAADVLTPGSTKSFFTVDKYLKDVDLSLQIETVRAISMGLTIPAEGMITLDIGWLGRNMVGLATGASPSLTTPSLTTTEPMAGIDAVITATRSGSITATYTAVSFNLNRGGGVQAVIGDTLSPDVYDGSAAGEGNLTGTVESLQWLSEVAQDDAATISILCPDGAGNTIQFDLANVQLENFAAPVGQAAAMITSTGFSFGGTNGVTITRNPI